MVHPAVRCPCYRGAGEGTGVCRAAMAFALFCLLLGSLGWRPYAAAAVAKGCWRGPWSCAGKAGPISRGLSSAAAVPFLSLHQEVPVGQRTVALLFLLL